MPATDAVQLMQCMEVWGGNEAFDAAVSMTGLDAWVYAKPYEQSAGGGDVYYVSACATGRINRLLIADVSGHGASVSNIAGHLRGLMRQYVNYLDQGEFVRAMNRQLVQSSNAESFVTAIVTTFFAPTQYLSLYNAGHPAPLLYRAREKSWNYLEDLPAPDAGVRNIPLGILDLETYQQFGLHLETGDLVLCYTDSLIESKDSSGDYLGLEGLLRIVRTVSGENPAEIIPKLLAAVGNEFPSNLTEDDVTILLFRPSGGNGTNLTRRVRAPFLVMGKMLGALATGKPLPRPDFTIPGIFGAMIPPLSRLWHPRTSGKEQ
jgi:hypothetical protein